MNMNILISGFKASLIICLFLGTAFLLTACNSAPSYLDEPESYLSTDLASDQRIKQDIATIRQALTLYARANDIYPQNLEDLVPEFLETVPKNPLTDQPYEYTADLISADYTLIYKLSDGQRMRANSGEADVVF
ncbi:hypothetical protein ACFL2B_02215 [Patescibacteria group bacterium]